MDAFSGQPVNRLNSRPFAVSVLGLFLFLQPVLHVVGSGDARSGNRGYENRI